MTRTIIAISVDLDQLELLNEIKGRYHLKNLSRAVETIIKQWQMLLEQKKQEQTAAIEKRKPVNPMVNP